MRYGSYNYELRSPLFFCLCLLLLENAFGFCRKFSYKIPKTLLFSDITHKHQDQIKTKTCNKILFKFCPDSEHVQQLKHRNNMMLRHLVFTHVYVAVCSMLFCVHRTIIQTDVKKNNTVETHNTPSHLVITVRNHHLSTISTCLWI